MKKNLELIGRMFFILIVFGFFYCLLSRARKKTKVYTTEFISGLPEMNPFDNPIVVRLCKDSLPSNVQLREAIERWFVQLENKDKPAMLCRLRSIKDEEHLSAFFELALQNRFSSSGLEVEKDPVLPDGTTPDLKLASKNRESFIEIRTITENDESRRVKRSMTDALIHLNKIDTPYVLSVHFESDPARQIKPTALRKSVEKWLSKVSIESDDRQQERFQVGGYDVEVTASNYTGLTEGVDKVMYWSDPVKNLGASLGLMRRGIQKKYGKYKDVQKDGVPYVIAICSTDGNFVLEDIWMTLAAYGTLVDAPNTHGQFDVSGIQKRSAGLSGLLHCQLVQDRESFQCHFKYFPNPQANSPVPFDILPSEIKHFQ